MKFISEVKKSLVKRTKLIFDAKIFFPHHIPIAIFGHFWAKCYGLITDLDNFFIHINNF